MPKFIEETNAAVDKVHDYMPLSKWGNNRVCQRHERILHILEWITKQVKSLDDNLFEKGSKLVKNKHRLLADTDNTLDIQDDIAVWQSNTKSWPTLLAHVKLLANISLGPAVTVTPEHSHLNFSTLYGMQASTKVVKLQCKKFLNQLKW